MVIKVNSAQLQKELTEAQAMLEKKPNRWRENERVGRVLYWMKDSRAKEYLLNAAKLRLNTFKSYQPQDWELISIGNYFRLAGETEIANNYFLRAYEMQKRDVGDIHNLEEVNLNSMQFLIMTCFLLKRYEETIMYGNIYRFDNPNPNVKLLAHRFTELAEAKMTNDLTKAEQAVDMIAAGIRSAKGKIQGTGIITAWDAYELGLEVLEEIETATND